MAQTVDLLAKHPRLRAVREIEVRVRPTGLQVPMESTAIRGPRDAANIFKAVSDRRSVESLLALHLDARHRPIGVHEVARGAGNVVNVAPRDLFAAALATGANAVIIAHNHPSGEASPSNEDVNLTHRLRAGGDLIGVPVLDHVIIGEEDAYSFDGNELLRGVWEKGKSYSVGGWGSVLLAATSVVGVLAIVAVLRSGKKRDGSESVVGKSAERRSPMLGLDVFAGCC